MISSIKISDTGIGMTEQVKNSVFSIRPESSYGTKNEKGIGLVLSLSKEFTEMQGGRIWFETSLGCGITFFISMPITWSSIIRPKLWSDYYHPVRSYKAILQRFSLAFSSELCNFVFKAQAIPYFMPADQFAWSGFCIYLQNKQKKIKISWSKSSDEFSTSYWQHIIDPDSDF